MREDRLGVHHTWLLEDQSDSSVRILSQETKVVEANSGAVASKAQPDQDWFEGIVAVIPVETGATVRSSLNFYRTPVLILCHVTDDVCGIMC